MQKILHKKIKTRFNSKHKILVASLVIPAIHLCLCKICLLLSFQNGSSAIWLSAGLYLASFLLLGYRILPALFVGALIANSVFFYKDDFVTSTLIAICNVAKTFIASILLRRKQKILVVDDKWENPSVVENLLQAIGFEVKEAINDFTSSPQSSRLS